MAPLPKTLRIDGKQVGPGCPPYLIAEVGLAHEGSLGSAMAYADAVAAAGVDAVKFQTHLAEAEATGRERFRVPVFPQDPDRRSYWRRTAFTAEQWGRLADHCREAGVAFLSSAFSGEAVGLLEAVGVPAWKVASGEVSNHPLLEEMAATGKPVLLSSGLSSWAELDAAVELLRGRCPVAVFQCASAYPCPPREWGLNLIPETAERYGVPVGLSDHAGSTTPGIAAVALGASLLEFHVVWHRGAFGPDASASLTPEEVASLVAAVKAVHEARTHPVDRDAAAAGRAPLHRLFTKSVVAARDLPAGATLRRADLAFKKPGDGHPAAGWEQLVGRRLKAAARRDQRLLPEHLEGA